MGGDFYVAVELSESNPYFRIDEDEEGTFELYTELPASAPAAWADGRGNKAQCDETVRRAAAESGTRPGPGF